MIRVSFSMYLPTIYLLCRILYKRDCELDFLVKIKRREREISQKMRKENDRETLET